MNNIVINSQRKSEKVFKVRRFSLGKIILFIFLSVWAFIQIYPLFWLLLFSFKSNDEIFGGNIMGIPHKWLVSNYVTALTSGNVFRYFLNSVIVTGITIIISSVLIASASYAIARMKWKLSKPVLFIFLMGMMIPINATLLPIFLILQKVKLLNTYLALILPYIAFALPMGIFILTSFMISIPRELEEAACIDGCNVYQVFMKIIIPIVRPALATIAIFTYLSSWNELMFANTFINDEVKKTLTVGIMSLSGQYLTNWGPIGAGLVIATVPTIVIYALLSEQVQQSLVAGAIKG